MPLDDYVESLPLTIGLHARGPLHLGNVPRSSPLMRYGRSATSATDAFIERARKCYAIVATSEEATYANILLRKGVVK